METAAGFSREGRSAARILIVGGGFGGVFAARYLKKHCPAGTHIEVINNQNYFVFQPLLPEVASGVINAQDAVTPHRVLLKGIRFRLAEVKSVDLKNKSIALLQGWRRRLVHLTYNHLVLAGGTVPNLERNPGFAEHSLTMKNLSDAFVLRNHVLQCLEWADVTDNPELKKRALTFVVAGGGFSGVETMGELEDMTRRTLRHYPNVSPDELHFVLIQRGGRILPELPEKLSAYSLKELTRRGVDVRLNTGLRNATGYYVETDRGERIPTATLVTTIGNGPTPLAASLPQCIRGRIPVNGKLQVEGVEDVWALGDAALIPMRGRAGGEPEFALPTAQFAVREAKALARNIANRLAGRPLVTFDFTPLGAMASLGAYRGVASFFGLRVTGVLAWSIWRGFYMLKLPGFVTRMRVALNWFLDYFVPRTIVEMQQDPTPAVRFARFGAGDFLFRPGELLDGLYVILSGKVEIRVKDPRGGEDFVRIARPQDHLGDRIRSHDIEVKGEVRALEETRVMVLDWEDLVRLRSSFDAFERYLQETSREKYPGRIYGASLD